MNVYVIEIRCVYFIYVWIGIIVIVEFFKWLNLSVCWIKNVIYWLFFSNVFCFVVVVVELFYDRGMYFCILCLGWDWIL